MIASLRRHGSFLYLVMVALADESLTENPAATKPQIIVIGVLIAGQERTTAELSL